MPRRSCHAGKLQTRQTVLASLQKTGKKQMRQCGNEAAITRIHCSN